MSNSSYAFSRGTLASTRLYVQHWMWRYQLGYLLSPHIPTEKDGLKIADVACGTGIWLIETARALPHARLDGYDISEEQFPRHKLPPNVKLSILDAVGLIPEELVAAYDVVHISLFVMLVRNENPAPILRNLILMLRPPQKTNSSLLMFRTFADVRIEPGGYLHWDESDIDTLHASLPTQHVSQSSDERIVAEMLKWCTGRGLTSKWVGQLDKLFSQHGLKVLEFRRLSISNDIAKPWTDNQIMAYEDVIENSIIPTIGDASPTADEWRAMFKDIVQKCQEGMSITMDMVVTVGQKAANR